MSHWHWKQTRVPSIRDFHPLLLLYYIVCAILWFYILYSEHTQNGKARKENFKDLGCMITADIHTPVSLILAHTEDSQPEIHLSFSLFSLYRSPVLPQVPQLGLLWTHWPPDIFCIPLLCPEVPSSLLVVGGIWGKNILSLLYECVVPTSAPSAPVGRTRSAPPRLPAPHTQQVQVLLPEWANGRGQQPHRTTSQAGLPASPAQTSCILSSFLPTALHRAALCWGTWGVRWDPAPLWCADSGHTENWEQEGAWLSL